MTRLVFATGRLMELYLWNRWPLVSASDLEMVSYATQCAAKALAEAPHWQIIESISKMYFSLWKTPGVSERMWSVNLEASISGEYQTLGRDSGRPSE